MTEHVASESDERTVNNTDAMRHNYRVLTDREKIAMGRIKNHGQVFLEMIDACVEQGRENSIAKTKVEEAVMWAVKGLTK